jgi:S1-C subfamily serine protease
LAAAVVVLASTGIVAAQSEYAGRGGSGAVNSVYRVVCPDQDRGATGFGHKSGRIITAEHAVHGCDPKRLQIVAPSGAATGVKAILVDADLDLALLTASTPHFVKVPLDITAETTFTFGSQVSTWGFPEGYGGLVPLLSVGYLSGVDEHRSKPTVVLRKWVVNGAFNRGNSGGPVLETKTAKVLGVISSKLAPIPKELEASLERLAKSGSIEAQTIARVLQHLRGQTQLVIGFATMTEDLKKFLQSNGVEP